MASDSFGKKRRDPIQQVTRVVVTDHAADSKNAFPAWLKPGIWIGMIVAVFAVIWASSGQTITAAEECRRGNTGHESCALKPEETFVSCGWIKCGGIFSSASESTHDRLSREDQVRRIEERQGRERERVQRALEGERSGKNRNVKLNPLD